MSTTVISPIVIVNTSSANPVVVTQSPAVGVSTSVSVS